VDHVYGETENGGTSYLMISNVPFAAIGMPLVPAEPVATNSEQVMQATIPFALGWTAALTGLAAVVRLRNRGAKARAEQGEAVAESKEKSE